jgi:hypothetical protein
MNEGVSPSEEALSRLTHTGAKDLVNRKWREVGTNAGGGARAQEIGYLCRALAEKQKPQGRTHITSELSPDASWLSRGSLLSTPRALGQPLKLCRQLAASRLVGPRLPEGSLTNNIHQGSQIFN